MFMDAELVFSFWDAVKIRTLMLSGAKFYGLVPLVEWVLHLFWKLSLGNWLSLETNWTWHVYVSKKGKTRVGPKIRAMAGNAQAEPVNEQAVANIYGSLRAEINQIYSKITELEMEVSEHSLVINAIQPLDPSRRCYRMIGGVLVERTIKEVLPAVQRNKEGLEEVISRLNEALEKKKKEVAEFEAKYKIRIRKADEMKDEGNKKEGTAQGVLVGPAGASNE
ncbi:hypothetical protein M9H77_35168 [Catharanthus roseus]|uniref:Uncharacterized protein n=1 Tax=Catharanthus roseus TaxID=4058 RepID=A0ACB9ZQ46_CATRO|nr:hypothetical protein M9H77_35168 [Catharanthus roseus]